MTRSTTLARRLSLDDELIERVFSPGGKFLAAFCSQPRASGYGLSPRANAPLYGKKVDAIEPAAATAAAPSMRERRIFRHSDDRYRCRVSKGGSLNGEDQGYEPGRRDG